MRLLRREPRRSAGSRGGSMTGEEYSVEIVPDSPGVGWDLFVLGAVVSGAFVLLLLLLGNLFWRAAGETLYLEDLEAGHEPMPFPRKEDKVARFRRWARVMRRKCPPARLPIKASHVEVNVQVAIEAFTKGGDWISCGPGSSRIRIPGLSVHSFPTGLEGAPKGTLCSLEEKCAGAERPFLSEKSAERVRERILHFLLEAGPAKRLCSIPEEDEKNGVLSPPMGSPQLLAAWALRSPLRAEQEALLPPTIPPLPQDNAACNASASLNAVSLSQRAAKPLSAAIRQGSLPPALFLDGEEVIRVGITGKPITRELLWAALAKIHHETPNKGQG